LGVVGCTSEFLLDTGVYVSAANIAVRQVQRVRSTFKAFDGHEWMDKLATFVGDRNEETSAGWTNLGKLVCQYSTRVPALDVL